MNCLSRIWNLPINNNVYKIRIIAMSNNCLCFAWPWPWPRRSRDLDLSLGFDGFVVHAELLVVVFGNVSVSPQVQMLLLGDALHLDVGWMQLGQVLGRLLHSRAKAVFEQLFTNVHAILRHQRHLHITAWLKVIRSDLKNARNLWLAYFECDWLI